MPRIAFATYAKKPAILPDDEHFARALRERGNKHGQAPMDVVGVVWDENHTATWTTFDAVVVRSVWDYFTKPHAFFQWLTALEQVAEQVAEQGAERDAERDSKQGKLRVWNDCAIMRWNADKTYLRELEQAGVSIVPTIWLRSTQISHNNPEQTPKPALETVLEAALKLDLEQVVADCPWHDLILKPSISAGSYKTARFSRSAAHEYQSLLQDILTESTAMLQPLVPEILAVGEYSFVFLNTSTGAVFSHAVLKSATDGEFRIQEKYGGTTRALQAAPDLIAQAHNVLDTALGIVATHMKSTEETASEPRWLFARVDGVERDGKLLLMELEMIEPSLFFTEALAADEAVAERFADSLLEALAM
jgi:hypothetical protein